MVKVMIKASRKHSLLEAGMACEGSAGMSHGRGKWDTGEGICLPLN